MSLTKGLISVIVPCYNNSTFLRKCIDSLLVQTYTNFEIIIVDDGSVDKPGLSVEDIKDSRFRGIISMPHHGVSSTRNVGIHHALGEYIVFIDGDDWVEPNHLEILVKGLEHADCTIIMMQLDYPDRSEVNDSCLRLACSNPILKSENFNLLFENYLLSSPCNKIYRTNLIREIDYLQFDQSISYAEDLLFNLEYFRMINSVMISSAITYHYVKHGESGTTRYHQNTAYTLNKISGAVKKLLGTELSKMSKSILMRHYLWGFSNLHHTSTPQTDTQVLAEIKMIMAISEYKDAKSTLQHLGISRGLRWLLQLGNPSIIHFGYKCLGR